MDATRRRPQPHQCAGLFIVAVGVIRVGQPVERAASALKARVVHDEFDWEGDQPPGIALQDTVLYELHVKGFSKLNPLVPEALRGTYTGLAHPASLAHLRVAVNITAEDIVRPGFAAQFLDLVEVAR